MKSILLHELSEMSSSLSFNEFPRSCWSRRLRGDMRSYFAIIDIVTLAVSLINGMACQSIQLSGQLTIIVAPSTSCIFSTFLRASLASSPRRRPHFEPRVLTTAKMSSAAAAWFSLLTFTSTAFNHFFLLFSFAVLGISLFPIIDDDKGAF